MSEISCEKLTKIRSRTEGFLFDTITGWSEGTLNGEVIWANIKKLGIKCI